MKQLTEGSTRRALDIANAEHGRLSPLLTNFLPEPALANATAGGVGKHDNARTCNLK